LEVLVPVNNQIGGNDDGGARQDRCPGSRPYRFCHRIFALWVRFFIAFGGGNANFISNMPDEQQPELNQPGPRKRSINRRRGRRGGRGRNLRPAHHATAPAGPATSPAAGEAAPPPEEHLPETTGAEIHAVEKPQPEPKPAYRPAAERPVTERPRQERSHPEPHAPKHAPPSLTRAVDDVRQVVESLEEALEQMEHVLELVELAEEQKFDDEREIENLRRALRRLQTPRHEPQRERRPERPHEEKPREVEEREERPREESQREEPAHESEPEHEGGDEPPPEEFGSEEQAS